MSEHESTAAETVEQGAYEIIRRRLEAQAQELSKRARALNERRLEVFGGTEIAVVGNERIRTENNCVPCDIVDVGGRLLFGYNVFIGLKSQTRVEDVFSVHEFRATDEGFAFEPVAAPFLKEPAFVRDFEELYQYYRDTRLVQLRRVGEKLLAVFRIGAAESDVKVFRWRVHLDGRAEYLDNRGERDNVFPPSHDFEWRLTTREDHVSGPHPHVSILDEVFVEAVGGDLTVKVEDNTEDGLGVYRELVEDADQALHDADIRFAKIGTLILLKIRPYREEAWRHLVFNTRTQEVRRIDAIGEACVSLPEDHGIIFPGGYVLRDGESKTFEGEVQGMKLSRVVQSPNGEDVLYVFTSPREGRRILLSYNLIRKEVANPVHCHGYCLFPDGKLIVFRAVSAEPTRVHGMQVWQTPYCSDEHAAGAPKGNSFLERVGNRDLVRGISDGLSIVRLVSNQEPTRATYEDLIAAVERMADAYYWLGESEVGDLGEVLSQLRETSELVVDEFEKVRALRERASEALEASRERFRELQREIRPDHWESLDPFVEFLGRLRALRGQVISQRELRHVDRAKLDELEAEIVARSDELSDRAVQLLLADGALASYEERIDERLGAVPSLEKVAEADELAGELEEVSEGLDLLTEIVGGFDIDDATVRTAILESISEVFGRLNRARAELQAHRKELLGREGSAEFGVQFKLVGQAASSALALADTPEACDEQLARLMLQLEELEGKFAEFDDFLEQVATKREDVYEAFSSKKQLLLDERRRRADRIVKAAGRVLEGIARRARSFTSQDELNAYFAADPMVAKVREQAERLRELEDSVRADELESRLLAVRDEAARGARDRADIYEEGTSVIRLGRHRFSVNTQALDLTLVPGDHGLVFALTGTDYSEPVRDEAFERTRPFWDQFLVSETDEVYRGEYLAADLLHAAESGRGGRSLAALQAAAASSQELLELVRKEASERYDEGYERGLHDHDAASILERLLALQSAAGLLRFAPRPRALASLAWSRMGEERELLARRARSLAQLRRSFGASPEIPRFAEELGGRLVERLGSWGLEVDPTLSRLAGRYLFEELGANATSFVTSASAAALRDALMRRLADLGKQGEFQQDLRRLEDQVGAAWSLARAWLEACVADDESLSAHASAVDEAAALLLTERELEREVSSASVRAVVEGLLGQHPRIVERRLELRLDEFLERTARFREERVPGYREFQQRRHDLLERERDSLRLGELVPKPMSGFVRNRLIDEVYLPIVGDNLAKQVGALGDSKRTDNMGMLLLVSPPGYGKTMLMEYLANRLGLVFVKVNGPALGHSVVSLDPQGAPDVTARQELEKLNLALEMGNNVLLYVDDIQHVSPEFLQKFISLCDAQRKIEGVWKGRSRTYDLRGKKFVVCMAGNPYTESGEKFRIPDMLANRADVYNLGDVLSGRETQFASSYLENALTSNPVLAPLASREPAEVQRFIRIALGDAEAEGELTGAWSAVEIQEIAGVLKKLVRIRDVLLTVNAEYIRSASMDDRFRTEPRFQLQGSYRNMNKMAEKVVAVMNDDELEALIDDHYRQEAQTLTTGAEQNLLKLQELRGRMSVEQERRWAEVKRSFERIQVAGESDEDPVARLTGQLALVSERLGGIGQSIVDAAGGRRKPEAAAEALAPLLQRLDATLQALGVAGAPDAVVLGNVLTKLDESFARLAQAQQGGGSLEISAATIDRLAAAVGRLGRSAGGGEALAESLAPVLESIGERLAEVADARSAAVREETMSAIQEQLAAMAGNLGNIREQVADAGGPDASKGAVEAMAPYLERLEQMVEATLKSQLEADHGRRLTGAVHDLLDRHVVDVEEQLLPTLHAVQRKLKASTTATDKKLLGEVDEALKSFDHVRQLTGALRRGDGEALESAARKKPPGRKKS